MDDLDELWERINDYANKYNAITEALPKDKFSLRLSRVEVELALRHFANAIRGLDPPEQPRLS